MGNDYGLFSRMGRDALARAASELQEDVFSLKDELATLRAENERLREALQVIVVDTGAAQEFYDRNGPQWTSPQGNEYEDTSAYLAKMEELHTIAKEALK